MTHLKPTTSIDKVIEATTRANATSAREAAHRIAAEAESKKADARASKRGAPVRKKSRAASDWVPELPPVGSTVEVHYRIVEAGKAYVRRFGGLVIRHNGSGMATSITVRRIVAGEGVERIFPIHSPKIERIEVKKLGRTRRAKLYYMRQRVGKRTRLTEIIRPGQQRQQPAAPAGTAPADSPSSD